MLLKLKNAGIQMELCIPDRELGYYRGTRFDWSGIFHSIQADGANYVEEWFDDYDPLRHDCVCGPVDEFAQTVADRFGCRTWAPYPGCEVDLLTNEIVNEGMKIPAKPRKAAQRKADSAFDRLVAAGKRLLDIIYRNEGLSNRDKARFESQINNLADKWEE